MRLNRKKHFLKYSAKNKYYTGGCKPCPEQTNCFSLAKFRLKLSLLPQLFTTKIMYPNNYLSAVLRAIQTLSQDYQNITGCTLYSLSGNLRRFFGTGQFYFLIMSYLSVYYVFRI